MTRDQVKEAGDKSWGQAAPAKYQVGDTVEYLPHECHAFNCNSKNEYPYVIGLKQNPHYEVDPKTGKQVVVEDIVELDEGHLHRAVLPQVRNAPNPGDQKNTLVPVRPRHPWPAVIRAVNGDGTVDLDIASNVGGGITLHYNRVQVDEGCRTPHSCHKPKEGA